MKKWIDTVGTTAGNNSCLLWRHEQPRQIGISEGPYYSCRGMLMHHHHEINIIRQNFKSDNLNMQRVRFADRSSYAQPDATNWIMWDSAIIQSGSTIICKINTDSCWIYLYLLYNLLAKWAHLRWTLYYHIHGTLIPAQHVMWHRLITIQTVQNPATASMLRATVKRSTWHNTTEWYGVWSLRSLATSMINAFTE